MGDNTVLSKSSPVSVGGGHSFAQVAAGGFNLLARKADGSVWTWGPNSVGQLGDGTSVGKSSPVSVIGGHSFVDVSGTAGNTVIACKADGSVWTWGGGSNGLLGDGTGSNRSSPVSVASVTLASIGHQRGNHAVALGTAYGI